MMKAGYFFSDEPGYYEKGKFGIRLETVLMTVEKNDLPYGTLCFLLIQLNCMVAFVIQLSRMTYQKNEGLSFSFIYFSGDKDVASGGGKQFLGFEPVALIPFEPKLIDFTLLNREQIDWLNSYNRLIKDKIGKELKKQKKHQRLKRSIFL